jgi:hypothetical protein
VLSQLISAIFYEQITIFRLPIPTTYEAVINKS